MEDSVTCVDLHLLVSRSINMLSVTDFDPKGIISGVRVQAGLYLDMLDADRSPNAVSVHAGTSQVDFEVDRPPPAPPGHLLITMVRKAVFCKKNEFRKMKKVVSLIDLKVMKTRNDCEIACDCVKRANVVLHVGLWKEIFARKHTATHKPTSAQPLYSYQRDIHLTRSLVAWSPAGLLSKTKAPRLDQCKHFRKSKRLLRSEVNRCAQSSIELHLRRSTSTGE